MKPAHSSADAEPVGVLFVCLGNICRSPLAEGIFRHRAAAAGVLDRFRIDSAGTGGWHAGELADPRMRQVALSRGVRLESRARQVQTEDFTSFQHIICMDRENLRIVRGRGAPKDRSRLMLSFDPDAPLEEVPDPYYGGDAGFVRVFDLVDAACAAMLRELCPDHS